MGSKIFLAILQIALISNKYQSTINFVPNSRAHTIVAINFSQKGENAAGQNTTMTSIINLVDLAGRFVSTDL